MYCNKNNEYNNPYMKIYSFIGPTSATGPTGPTGATGPTGSVQPNPYDLYVESSAATSGDGTEFAPFQTIEEALAVARPNIIKQYNKSKYTDYHIYDILKERHRM